MIPTYNRRETLAACLATVLDQDTPAREYEIIIVVDGSTDGTAEMLASHRERSRLIVIKQDNQGQAAARNAGARVAGGELVLFLDDDLLCDPRLLAAHASAHHTVPTLVFGSILAKPGVRSSFAERWTRNDLARYYERLEESPLPQWPDHAWAGPNCSMQRAVFLECGGYDDKLFSRRGEDVDLGVRLWKMGVAFRFEPQAVTYHQWVKSDRQLWDDSIADGASNVALCRKHPELRQHSGFVAIVNAPVWKRHIARAAAGPATLFRIASELPISLLEKFPLHSRAQPLGMRLFLARRNVAMLAGGCKEVGSWQLLRKMFGPRIPVLLYHHIGVASSLTKSLSLTVTPAKFKRQIRWLSWRGYKGITPTQWLACRTTGEPIPRKPILLTFDDAYVDVTRYALPVLKKYGFGAAVFVITSKLRDGTSWEGMPVMTIEQAQVSASERIEIGGHSQTHPDLTTLSDGALAEEVAGSKSDLINAGIAPRSFAYPYGLYDDKVRESVGSSFSLAFTCDEGVNDLRTDPLLLRRTMVQPGDTLLDVELRAALGWSPLTLNPLRSRLRLRSRFKGLLQKLRNLR